MKITPDGIVLSGFFLFLDKFRTRSRRAAYIDSEMR